MLAIFKKELRSYFISAIGYVYVGVFLAVSALLLCYTTLASSSYNTSGYFTYLLFTFIILIPLLTMRLLSEEKKLRTEQLLLTAPVTIWGMVFGKFLAAFTLFGGSLLVSCINFIPLYAYGFEESAAADIGGSIFIGPSTGQIVGCLVGILLIGAAFIALGMFISSLTENQLAAAVVTVTVIIIMLALSIVNNYIETYAVRVVIDWICVLSRFSMFSAGYFDFAALLYYASITAIFLLLAVRVYDKRRWG
jgi:ABC-2 type transport system permease protein